MQRISYLQTDIGILNDLLAYIRLDAANAEDYIAARIKAKCDEAKKILDSGDIEKEGA